MNIAVSNISWSPEQTDAFREGASKAGAAGLEAAPGLLWSHRSLPSEDEAKVLGEEWRSRGLPILGFHALLFDRPDLWVLAPSPAPAFVQYIEALGRLCVAAGGRTLVFGSPRNRDRQGLSEEEAFGRAVRAFRACAEALGGGGAVLLIEPLAPTETTFIKSLEEGNALVEAVNHPAFGLHLDVRALWESSPHPLQEILRYGSRIKHVHASDPSLSLPGTTGRVDHRAAGEALRSVGYQGVVTLEVRRGPSVTVEVLAHAVEWARHVYGGVA